MFRFGRNFTLILAKSWSFFFILPWGGVGAWVMWRDFSLCLAFNSFSFITFGISLMSRKAWLLGIGVSWFYHLEELNLITKRVNSNWDRNSIEICDRISISKMFLVKPWISGEPNLPCQYHSSHILPKPQSRLISAIFLTFSTPNFLYEMEISKSWLVYRQLTHSTFLLD